MVCVPVVMGIVGGALAAKLVMRRAFGGRCGHGGWRHHGRHHGPWRIFRLARALDLNRAQKDAIEELLSELREEASDLRGGGREALDAALGALAGDEFDRVAVEAEAARQGERLGQARDKLVAALERLHAILIPEQREKLRSILARTGRDAGGPAGGPYRTSV